MKTIAAVVVLMAGGTACAQNSSANSTPLNVNVTNPSLNVHVTNPTTTVQVGNTNPIPVALSTSEQPFQTGRTIAQSDSGAFIDLVTVPAGQSLVIEHVSANIGVRTSLQLAQLWRNSTNVADTVACNQTGTTADGSSKWYGCSCQTRIYYAAGDTVRFTVVSVDGSVTTYDVNISGHTVPTP